jgi:hypothetical protein
MVATRNPDPWEDDDQALAGWFEDPAESDVPHWTLKLAVIASIVLMAGTYLVIIYM